MNTSFWSQCQGLVRRLQKRHLARPRDRQRGWCMAETLEPRALLSSTPAMVADIIPGPDSSIPRNLVAIGSTVYFTADDGIHGQELWKSDGTAAGTMMVKDINVAGSSTPVGLINFNGTLYFSANDYYSEYGTGLHGHGYELWKSDGTAAGTVMVKDIAPGIAYSNPLYLTNVNGTLYFRADDGVHGSELWKSNGTAAGTVMVKDINPSGGSSNPRAFANVNGTIYFSADDGIHGQELWKTDGTAAGTTMVKDLFPGAHPGPWGASYLNGSWPGGLTNVNGTLFFVANGGDGYELWTSDGTAAGTTMVKDLFPGETSYYRYYGDPGYGINRLVTVPNGSFPGGLTVRDGTLYFIPSSGDHAHELWKSDGTDAGTVKAMDTPSILSEFTDWNGTLYFRATDGVHGVELWKSDLTAAGTVMVKDINPGSAAASPWYLTVVNGTLYFTAYDDVDGYAVWKSDGTTAGTVMVSNIVYADGAFTNANGTLFFRGEDVHGVELWALETTSPPVSTISLGVSGFPVTTTAGVAGSFTVTMKNADGSTNTGYVGKIHFTSSDPQAVLPADYTFTAADLGVHTFTATLKTAGSQSLTAADAQSPATAGTESSILVKSAVESTLIVSGFPATATAGTAANVTITLLDPYGNIATGYVGTVHFTSSDPKAVLPADYTFTAADAGKHTFSVILKTAGVQSITAGGVIRLTLSGTQTGIKVNAAAASQFLLSAPTSVKAGTTFSLTMTVRDAYGNVVTGYIGKVHFTSTDGSARLPADYTFTAADNGVHSFSNVVLRKKGNQRITATDRVISSLTGSAIVSVR